MGELGSSQDLGEQVPGLGNDYSGSGRALQEDCSGQIGKRCGSFQASIGSLLGEGRRPGGAGSMWEIARRRT